MQRIYNKSSTVPNLQSNTSLFLITLDEVQKAHNFTLYPKPRVDDFAGFYSLPTPNKIPVYEQLHQGLPNADQPPVTTTVNTTTIPTIPTFEQLHPSSYGANKPTLLSGPFNITLGITVTPTVNSPTIIVTPSTPSVIPYPPSTPSTTPVIPSHPFTTPVIPSHPSSTGGFVENIIIQSSSPKVSDGSPLSVPLPYSPTYSTGSISPKGSISYESVRQEVSLSWINKGKLI